MTTKNLKEVKKIIEEFFQRTTITAEVEVLKPEDKTISVKVKVEEPKILIGQNGQTLIEIQRLLKAILRRKLPEEQFYIDLDINDYKKRKIEYLKETAKSLADEVALTKKEKTLEPMPAYERRIIHLALADREDVVTQSTGEGPERRIVIKPPD